MSFSIYYDFGVCGTKYLNFPLMLIMLSEIKIIVNIGRQRGHTVTERELIIH